MVGWSGWSPLDGGCQGRLIRLSTAIYFDRACLVSLILLSPAGAAPLPAPCPPLARHLWQRYQQQMLLTASR